MTALSTPARPAPSQPWLLGRDRAVRLQVMAVLFSASTYLLYAGISAALVRMELMAPAAALALALASLLVNLLFYGLVRSGRVAGGRDPGLARTQLVVGILFMYAGYAAAGPAATAVLVVMASHVVYAMFSMTPRQVWQLVLLSIAGLALTMLACGLLWPERHPAPVQLAGLLYAALVLPLIAQLADKVTTMTTRLKSQRRELEAALARLQELATRDELTLAHNRRHMLALLQQQQAQHRRQGQPLALALIDLDLFKAINDRHGHAVGDQVLCSFARLAQAQLREGDELARWGGEEFLVLMPRTRRAEARQVMDRLQQQLASQAAACMPLGLGLSFSAGVTELEADEPLAAAVERADQAMYRAKASGRACTQEG